MTNVVDTLPGDAPPKGLIRTAHAVGEMQGANSGLGFLAGGNYIVSAWCGPSSSFDTWTVVPGGLTERRELEVQLSDMGFVADPTSMPPGVVSGSESWPTHILPIVDAAVSADGTLLAVTAAKGVRTFRFDTSMGQWKETESHRGHQAAVVRIAVSTDGRLMASADASGRILVWTTGKAAWLHDVEMSRAPRCAALIWQNSLLAVGDDTGRVICWRVSDGGRHLQFQAHRGACRRLVFNSTTGTLLTVGDDQVARVWDLQNGRQVGKDMRHRGPIYDAVVSPKGDVAVTAGEDGYVAAWDVRAGRLLDVLLRGQPVYKLANEPGTGRVALGTATNLDVLEVDWDELMTAGAAPTRPTMNSGAFRVPPSKAEVTYEATQETAYEAPVGSVMAARRTAELPALDENALAAMRARAKKKKEGAGASAAESPGSAALFGQSRGLASGNYAAVAPADTASSGRPTAPSGGYAAVGSNAFDATAAALGAGGPEPERPFGARTGGHAAVSPEQEKDPIAHLFGQPAPEPKRAVKGAALIGGRPAAASGSNPSSNAASGTGHADEFFGGDLDEDDPFAPVADDYPDRPIPGQGAEPAAIVAAPGGKLSVEDLLEADAPDVTGSFKAVPRPKSSARINVKIAAGALGAALVLTVGIWFLVSNHYKTNEYPDAVASEASALEETRDVAITAANLLYDDFETDRRQYLSEVEDRVLPAEFERLQNNAERELAARAETRDEAIAAANRAFDESLAPLQERRAAAAGALGWKYGGIAGGITLLLGLLLAYMRRDD